MRADKYLVEHGYFDTRARAQAAIAAGKVSVNDVILVKPSQTIPEGAEIVAEAAHPYVSRAALKLVKGLDAFDVDPAGKRCLDIGSSTGGFTEVLLERGAALDAAHPEDATAFHRACCYNQPDCAEALARAGCDVGLKDSDGQTGREMAEVRGGPILPLLLPCLWGHPTGGQ